MNNNGVAGMNNDDVLRRAFEAQAAGVEVAADALGSIRRRVHSRRRRRRVVSLTLASLATSAVAVVTALLLGFGGLPRNHAPIPGDTFGTATNGTTNEPPTPSSTPVAGASVPVYYVGRSAGRPVLYREFRAATGSPDTAVGRMSVAVSFALAGAALDPDYASAWPAGTTLRSLTVAEVSAGGGVAVVDLAGARANQFDVATQRAALQQVIWTVTAVAADRGVKLRGVRLRFDGVSLSTVWSGLPSSGVLTRASALDTLASVWLVSPQQGDTVGHSFDIHVAGAVFEAAARVRVRDSAGAVVLDRPVLLSVGAPQRGEAHLWVTFPPGRYTVEAYYLSAVDGAVKALDDKTITVA